MGFLSDILGDSSSLLKEISSSSNNADEPLSVEMQDYATGLATTLKGPDAQPVVTASQLNALDMESSMQLLQDADVMFEDQTVDVISSGKGDIKTVQNAAREMATFNAEASFDGGLPAASAINASIQDLAESEVDNPEIAALPQADRQRAEAIMEKYAAAEYTIRTMPKASTWSWAKSVANKFVPIPGFLDQRTYQDLLKHVGIESAGKIGTAENVMMFRGFLNRILKDERTTAQNVPGIFNTIREQMIEKGGNPEDINDLFTKAFIDYDPASETFYDILDVAAAIPVTKAITMTGKAAVFGGKEAAKVAAKGAAKEAIAYLNPVPFTDKYVQKGVNRVVKASVNTADNVGKALRNKNRVKAADAVIESIGLPTDKENPFRVLDEKKVYERGLDSAVKPEEFMEPSVANDAYVAAAKADKTLEGKIEVIKSLSSKIHDVKVHSWEEAAKDLENTLIAEDIVGAGKAGIGDLVKAYQEGNVQMTQQGNLIATLTMQKSFDSVLENGLDKGLSQAMEFGKSLSRDLEDATIGYSVEKYAGKWYTKISIDTHKGWGTIASNYLLGKETKKESWSPFLSSFATVTSNPEDIRMLNLLRSIDANVITSSAEAAKREYEGLNKADKKLVQALADISIRNEAWYTPEHLEARGVSDKAIRAYEAYRTMNDIDAFIMNVATREDLIAKGAKRISFCGETIPGVGRVVPLSNSGDLIKKIRGDGSRPARDIMFNNISGDLKSTDEFSDKALEDLFSKGYKLIEGSISPDMESFKASSFYYLLNPDQTVVNELGEFVMSYVAGGRRFFDREGGFLKQLKIGETAKGRKAIVGVNTLAADKDFVGLMRRGNILEEIRVACAKEEYLKADKIISEAKLVNAPFTNHIEFKSWAEEHGIDLKNINNSLETVKNGHLLSSYDKLKSMSDVDDFVGLEEMSNLSHRSHFQAISQEAKQAKKRRTGKELFNYDFDVAHPVDIEQQMRYMVNDMVYSGVMKDFTDMYAERYSKLFKNVVTVRGVSNPSPVEMLLNGTTAKGLTGAQEDLAAAAETARKNYFAIKGIPTDFDATIARNANVVLRWVGGAAEDVLKLNDSVAHKARLKWEEFADKDPMGYVRAMTAHEYLGWFNIPQLWRQGVADIQVALLEPIASVKAARWSFPFATALRKSDGNVMKAMDKLATTFGDAPEAVRIDFENMIKLGVYEHGVGGGIIEAGQTVKSKLNKISMAPFNVAEMHNRTFAYLTAIHSLGYHGKKLDTKQLAEVAAKGQRLFLNMDATGMSRLQTSSLGKTLMQFMGFRMRWVEAMLFDRGLTKAQKRRLALGTFMLVGGEGFLGVQAWSGLCNVYNNYFGKKDEGTVEDRSEIGRFIARGILNYASEEAGLDMDLAQALSLDFAEFTNDASMLSMLAPPSFNAISANARLLKRTATMIKESITGELTADRFAAHLELMARQRELPSSLNRAILGALIWKNGRDFNTKGQLTDEYNSTLKKVMYILGFNSLTQKDIAKAFSELQYNENKVETAINLCKPIISQYGRGNTDAYAMAYGVIQELGLSPKQLLEVWEKLDTYSYEANSIHLVDKLLEGQIEKESGTNLIQKERRAYQKHQQQGEE